MKNKSYNWFKNNKEIHNISKKSCTIVQCNLQRVYYIKSIIKKPLLVGSSSTLLVGYIIYIFGGISSL